MIEEFSISEDSLEEQKKEFSMKEIVLRHLRKIGDISCQEFTGGFWQKKPIKTIGGILFTEEYHEDVREAYCNAVNFLIDIVEPFGDDKLKTYLKDNENLDNEQEDVKKKLKLKRKTFREINNMFERTKFFKSSDIENE